jgi:hypothetical protein
MTHYHLLITICQSAIIAGTMLPSPQKEAPTHNMRPALRVGLIGGLTLGLAAAAQQVSNSPEMRMLGSIIVMTGLALTGWFAARETGAVQRQQGSGAGALSGLIAGLFVSAAFIALTLITSLDPANMTALQAQVEAQLSPAQMAQMQTAEVDIRTLTQFTLGLTVMCCGLGFPLLGLFLGAIGGASAAMMNNAPR